MRYALQDTPLISLIAAADTLAEFEELVTLITQSGASALNGIVSGEQAGIMDMMADDRFQGFRKPPLVMTFESVAARDDFHTVVNVEFSKRNALIDRQARMLEDAFKLTEEGQDDHRSLEEVYGLEGEDQWDRRTDEEKAADEERKKAFKEAQKKGDMSGESFGPNPNRKGKPVDPAAPKASVTDIRTVVDQDGNVSIDNVLAVKGLYADNGKTAEELEAEKPKVDPSLMDALAAVFSGAEVNPDIMADTEDAEIDVDGIVGVYRKVEVTGAKLPAVRDALTAAGEDIEDTFKRRNHALGCWIATLTERQGEQVYGILKDAGFDVELYAVSDAGERLVPKGSGVEVVDTSAEAEELPRPWNSRSKEYYKLKKAEAEENWKTVKQDEFIACGNYEGAGIGTVVYIVPKAYFKKQGKLFHKSLNIGHLLPSDLKEVSPGVYRTLSRDWNKVSFALFNSGKFVESLALQIHLNLLKNG